MAVINERRKNVRALRVKSRLVKVVLAVQLTQNGQFHVDWTDVTIVGQLQKDALTITT